MTKEIFWKIKRKIRNISFSRKIITGQKIFLIKSVYGFKVILDITKNVDHDFLLSVFEKENFDLIQNIAQKDWTVIDVGANIGLYTLLFSKLIGPKGAVYSFEPSDEAFFRLQQNIKLNNLENVSVHKMGVAEKAGIKEFHITSDDAYNSLGITPMKEVIEIKNINIVTIDDFIKENNIKRVNILKIDTEGADYLVLKGAFSLLSDKNAPIVLCEFNNVVRDGYDFELDSIIKLLTSHSYQLYEITNKKFKIFDMASSNSTELVCLKENHKVIFKNYFE
jgi:methyltransferase, FkbM family